MRLLSKSDLFLFIAQILLPVFDVLWAGLCQRSARARFLKLLSALKMLAAVFVMRD
jgi:hypothetical protein